MLAVMVSYVLSLLSLSVVVAVKVLAVRVSCLLSLLSLLVVWLCSVTVGCGAHAAVLLFLLLLLVVVVVKVLAEMPQLSAALVTVGCGCDENS